MEAASLGHRKSCVVSLFGRYRCKLVHDVVSGLIPERRASGTASAVLAFSSTIDCSLAPGHEGSEPHVRNGFCLGDSCPAAASAQVCLLCCWESSCWPLKSEPI